MPTRRIVYFGEQESRSFTCNIGCRKHQLMASVCVRKETVIAVRAGQQRTLDMGFS